MPEATAADAAAIAAGATPTPSAAATPATPAVPVTPATPATAPTPAGTPSPSGTPATPVVPDPATPAAPAEVKYDLKLPDNSTVDKALVERTVAKARELGLSQEQAQKALDWQVQELATTEQSAIEATLQAHAPGGAVWDKQVEDWNAAALADAEIGAGKPEQLQKSAALAKQVVAKFGDKESIEFLKKNPIGSHPALLRLLVRIAKASSEGSLDLPRTQDGSVKKDPKENLYGEGAPKVIGV